ncbi:hypothetical protein [Winogradskyella aurantia]|uniref:DoxX family protein n=1 Tax=Winogradskyella aurantia TaxID=1915063 RepID=A0A265UXS1_9FLAO|nr:hypothetical protein [Winogradskyella aurantia]OZV70113.1 hypothetical protein CA834_05710 [Winogradskyella aurantia]
MTTNAVKEWNRLKKFTILFFSAFFALEIIPSFINFFIRSTDGYYYPSFFVQNYILRLHDIPKWTHQVSRGGDTLDDWIQHLAYIIIAIIVALIFLVVDKRKNYSQLLLWTKIGIRYFLGPVMFLYGVNKLFLNQMVYPKLSYFYTPLGDFYPMDLVWTFVGYSATYQFIGGLLEFIAGILIMFRRTLVLGLLLFVGVMSQILMYNYFYGVGVKTFSTLLMIMGLFLLVKYIPKLIDFLLLGKSSTIEVSELTIKTPWKKKARLLLKYGFIVFALIFIVQRNYDLYNRLNSYSPIAIEGAYDVYSFKVNGTENTNYFDTERWNQIVVNKSLDGKSSDGHVSLGTTIRQLAHFEIDSLNQLTVTFIRDSLVVFKGVNNISGDSLVWNGKMGNDTAQFILKKNKRELPLHERPFRLINPTNGSENLRIRK